LTVFPDLESLLIEGDDHRLALNQKGNNVYCCPPKPREKLLRLGSSTGSNISPEQWQYAEHIHAEMRMDAQNISMQSLRQQHNQQIIQELHNTCHVADDVDIQLTDSGTQSHQLAMQHFCQKKPHATWDIVMIDASETGRGVPKALCLDAYDVRCHAIPIRQSNGEPLSAETIETSLFRIVQTCIQQHHDVVIILVDVSKTGYIAPSLELGLKLRSQHPEHIHLFLDACQFRFGHGTLNHYLQHNIPIAITGSKFLSAPSFCAALLIPQHCQEVHIPPKLGVLLRWQLALQSLRQLYALPEQDCAMFMKDFSIQIQRKLQNDDAFSILPTPLLQRTSNPQVHWQNYPTIFPFFLHNDGLIISHIQALKIFEDLQLDDDFPIQLGRPMSMVSHSNCEPLGIFRLSMSAQLIIQAIQQEQQSNIIQECIQALEKIRTECKPSMSCL